MSDPALPADAESFAEQVSRVQQMAEDDGQTWDLSDNDKAALKAVLAALAAVPGEQTWQDISTAPKDAPVLLLEPAELTGRTLYGHFVAGEWVANRHFTANGYWFDGASVIRPTHWMPLPSPPASSRETET